MKLHLALDTTFGMILEINSAQVLIRKQGLNRYGQSPITANIIIMAK